MLTIPSRDLDVLAKWLALSEQDQKAIVKALREEPATAELNALVRRVASRIKKPEKETLPLVQLLVTLYRVRERHGHGASIERFVNEISEAAIATGRADLKESSAWNRLRGILAEALTLQDTLGITAKALDIAHEHARVLQSTRVVTDVRPVFGANVRERPKAASVYHTLIISYYGENYEVRDFNVALDIHDVRRLKAALTRAEQKHETMVKLVKEAGIAFLQEEEEER